MAFRPKDSPIYTVWRDGGSPTEPRIETTALGIDKAAEIWARYYGRDLSDEHWPLDMRVRDPKGQIWSVIVERKFVPEFAAGKPARL